jgi:hypothetical protein
MKTKLILAALATCLLTAGPALAVSQPGCGPGEFLAYALGNIGTEQGGLNVTGNFISLTGSIRVGTGNVIHGTVMAENLEVGTNATVDVCATNHKTGTGTCDSTIPFDPTGCSFPPTPVPTFPAACSPGTNFTATVDTTLPEGCYGIIRVNAGVNLTLVDGGTYFAKGEVKVLNGGTLGAAGALANLTTKSLISSEPKATWQNMKLTTLTTTANAISTGNQNIFDNVLLFAPSGGIHPHAGSLLSGTSELVGKFLTIQPITNTPPPGDVFCTCPLGFKLAGPAQLCIPEVEARSNEDFFQSLHKIAAK